MQNKRPEVSTPGDLYSDHLSGEEDEQETNKIKVLNNSPSFPRMN